MCNETIKNNIDEVTSKVNNSLMKKTKAQLVEIILRKDDIERGLRADIKGTEKEFDKIKSKYKVLESKYCSNQTKYANLQMDYEEQCDEHILCKQELINKIKKRNIAIGLLVIINIFTLGLMVFI